MKQRFFVQDTLTCDCPGRNLPTMKSAEAYVHPGWAVTKTSNFKNFIFQLTNINSSTLHALNKMLDN